MILSGFWATTLSVFQIVKHCWLLPFSRLWHLCFDTKDSTKARILWPLARLYNCRVFMDLFLEAGNYDENTLEMNAFGKDLELLPIRSGIVMQLTLESYLLRKALKL